MAFSFSFSGDDIEADDTPTFPPSTNPSQAAETGHLQPRKQASSNTAFPITGQTLLPAKSHDLQELLETLPDRISYSTLSVKLDDGSIVKLPRRELWDVRVQIAAEDEGAAANGGAGDGEGLGNEDVKTGVYEGGFKSWECSVDLVRVLASRRARGSLSLTRVLEMGCGTALPSLALLQWALGEGKDVQGKAMQLILADYNPTVLKLVTVPNLLLSWAYGKSEGGDWEDEGELEIDQDLLRLFVEDLSDRKLSLGLLSGAWSEEFLKLFSTMSEDISNVETLVLAAETIYSPAALQSFSSTLMDILGAETATATALVGAKKVYFGVGGSMQDFIVAVEQRGGTVQRIREEEVGVRREVVEVSGRS